MQGRLIFINQPKGQVDGTGLIFGADRNRYRFELAEWRGGALPARNTMLEFEAAGDTALKVQLASEGSADALATEPVFTPPPSKTRGKAARPARPDEPAAPTPQTSQAAETIDLEAPLAAAPAPNLSAAPAARLLLTEVPSPRFPLKAFLIGLAIIILLVAAVMGITLFKHS
jgi:hypothetical protein